LVDLADEVADESPEYAGGTVVVDERGDDVERVRSCDVTPFGGPVVM
jgi:hypothetical protein